MEEVILDDTTVSGNHATNRGGGVFVWNGDLFTQDATLEGNTTDGDGAGVSVLMGVAELRRTVVEGNDADGSGGGLYVRGLGGDDLTLIDSLLIDNVAGTEGGAAYLTSIEADAAIQLHCSRTGSDRSGVVDNAADAEGGGVYFSGFSTLDITSDDCEWGTSGIDDNAPYDLASLDWRAKAQGEATFDCDESGCGSDVWYEVWVLSF